MKDKELTKYVKKLGKMGTNFVGIYHSFNKQQQRVINDYIQTLIEMAIIKSKLLK